jgi:phthalate 3,4-dioxygenase ferredoxin reductase component
VSGVPRALDQIAIVGSSVAGVSAARALRAEGYQGDVVLLGREPEWPYDKPPLSKQILSGEWEADRAMLLTAEQAQDLSLDVRLGVSAQALRVAEREISLSDGTVLPYTACVIATGASPRPSPWSRGPRVHELRTWQDALGIRERFLAGGPVAVVGGGFIGAEVASSARALGLPVVVIDPLRLPMERIVGPMAASMFTDLAGRNGVEMRFGHGVEAMQETEREVILELTDGTSVRADTVVVGIGVIPNDSWLITSGLVVDNGVAADEFCRAVGTDDVWVAGDVARWYHRGELDRVRVEHWTNAVDQAGCAAHNIVHPEEPREYAPVPYVWSDQYDHKFQIVGHPERGSRYELVGDVEHGRAAFIYEHDDGRLAGAVTVNWPRALVTCRRGLAGGADAASAVRALPQLATRA